MDAQTIIAQLAIEIARLGLHHDRLEAENIALKNALIEARAEHAPTPQET